MGWQDDKKAAGLGKISVRLIKSCKKTVGVHLQLALYEFNTEKFFPTKIKLAYVKPIFKKSDKLDSTNYRPISMTLSFAKILERLLLTPMTDFNHQHKFINKEQFGFEKISRQPMQFYNEFKKMINWILQTIDQFL